MMKQYREKISIIFSFLNEQENLKEIIARVTCVFHLLPFDYEMIFVNDDSTDGSLEILQEERKANPRIKIINMSRRFGVHPCVIAGLEASTGDAVIYMDTDLQDPPELIPILIQEWKKGAEVVHTKRKKRFGESKAKMALTLFAYKVINVLAEIKIPSNCGDYKLLSRRAVQEILKIKEHNPFMRGLSYWIGFKQSFVEYDRNPRYKGKTHFSLFGLGPIREFERGVITFSTFPLKISLIFGFVSAMLAFLYLPVILISKFLGLNIPGWTAIMSAIVFFNGVVLFTIGIMGLYIARIFHEVRGRPPFIIREKIGFEESDDNTSYLQEKTSSLS